MDQNAGVAGNPPGPGSAGTLRVSAVWRAGRLDGLTVRLCRPELSRALVGQTPARVAEWLPRLYSLCAGAQGAAAGAALAAAQGRALPGADAPALWREFLHESLWRLLLDWPPAFGLPPEPAAFAQWRRQSATADGGAATQALIEAVLKPLAEKCLARLVDRNPGDYAAPPVLQPDACLPSEPEGSVPMPQLPRPASVAAAYRYRLAGVSWAAAGLAEAREFPRAGAVGAAGRGWGVGQVPTARGILTHVARVEAERVRHYRIWAPTDAYFADAAPLAALLAEMPMPTAAAARQALAQAVLALDPCLPVTLELNDA